MAHFTATRLSRLSKNAFALAAALLVSVSTASPAQASLAGTYQFPVPWSAEGFGYIFGEYVPSLNKYHLADDMSGPADTTVVSVANGRVAGLYDFPGPYNYGGLVLVQHDNIDGSTVVSLYGHMDPNFAVVEGQEVQRGQLLGVLGDKSENGGWVEHIHFGVRKGAFINPSTGEWAYAGYGPESELAEWHDPTLYIQAHDSIIEVERVPSTSPDRFATAAGISAKRFPQPGTARQVLLANGYTYVDALASNAATTYLGAPLLLTKKDTLPQPTSDELNRVLPKGSLVTILGGTNAVDSTIDQQISALGFATQRIDGTNRYATAAALANVLPATKAAILTSGSAFADAVSAGAPAANHKLPLLLTRQDRLSPETHTFLEQHPSINHVVIVGGQQSISQDVVGELFTIPSIGNVERVAGPDRYATNTAMAMRFFEEPRVVVTATGQEFADALSGGSLAATQGGALLLSQSTSLPEALTNYVSPLRPHITAGMVLGGTTALSPDVEQQLAQLLNAPLNLAARTITTEPKLVANLYASANWAQAPRQEIAGTSVPVPDGFVARQQTYRGAQVAAVELQNPGSEVAPALVVSTLAVPTGTDPRKVVATYLNIDITAIQSTDLGILPGIWPAQTTYQVVNDTVVITEDRR